MPDITLPEAEPLDFEPFAEEAPEREATVEAMPDFAESAPETEEVAMAAAPDSELSLGEEISFDEEIPQFDESFPADATTEDATGDNVADFTFEPETEAPPETVNAEMPDITLPEAEPLDFEPFAAEAPEPEVTVEAMPDFEESMLEAAVAAVSDSELSLDGEISFDEEILQFDENLPVDTVDTVTEDATGDDVVGFTFEPEAEVPPEPVNAEIPDITLPEAAAVSSPAIFGRKTPGTGKPSGKEIVEMMLYLKNLTAVLPESKREKFINSDERLSLEHVITTLEGKKGLLREIQEKIPGVAASRQPVPSESGTAANVAGTLSYLDTLASSLPDAELLPVLKQRIAHIMSEMQAGST
jgi:hypothetical protein